MHVTHVRMAKKNYENAKEASDSTTEEGNSISYYKYA